MKKWAIEVDTIVTPGDIIEQGSVIINNGYIEDVVDEPVNTRIKLSCGDSVLSPGLINAHDHLLGTYFPKVGFGPYENWLPWDNDLKSDKTYRERQQIENRDLYLLGGYRNLLSGVTAVQDHIPHFVQEPFIDILPTKVISEFTLAHSVTSFALNWGNGIHEEYKLAESDDLPFITHIAEGFDSETVRDLDTIIKKGGLGPNSVFIHGIAFSEEDIAKIKAADASVVWCGDSNIFMFEKTANIRALLDAGVNVCIGTDSPMSGGENLLEEMRFDRQLYQELYNEELSNRQILQMVTKNPAEAFRLYDNGEVAPGKLADLVVFSHLGTDPFGSVVDARLADVKLVVIEGMPVYGNEEYADIFEQLEIDVEPVTIDGVAKLLIGDLEGLLARISRAVGFNKKFPFVPIG